MPSEREKEILKRASASASQARARTLIIYNRYMNALKSELFDFVAKEMKSENFKISLSLQDKESFFSNVVEKILENRYEEVKNPDTLKIATREELKDDLMKYLCNIFISEELQSQVENCICKGNWQSIIKESEPYFGKLFNHEKGGVYTFVGVVHCSDDYYYAMSERDSQIYLYSCVGSLKDFGFTPLIVEQSE